VLLYPAAAAASQRLQPGSAWTVWGAAAAGLVIMTGVSLRLAARTTTFVEQQRTDDADAVKAAAEVAVVRVRALLTTGVKDVQRLIEQTRQGEGVTFPAVDGTGAVEGSPLSVLEWDVHRFVAEVGAGVADASARSTNTALMTIGRRMLPLIEQMLSDFDALYRDTEDPGVLTPLFRLDHTATRLRRLAESFALVGGAVPRRSTRATPLLDVIHHAISEVERYQRVKVASPAAGLIRGDAVPGLIHILAELIDNATAYSPPTTPVEIRVDPMPWGVAIEVDDRGRLLPPQTRHELNMLLEDPAPHAAGQLGDGRLGLWVVAGQARRLGIRVQLRSNAVLSNQAVVFLPKELFAPETDQEVTQALSGPAASRETRSEPAAPTLSAKARVTTAPAPLQAQAPEHRQADGSLPIRQPGRSYMAAELARRSTAAAADALPAQEPAPHAGLVAQVAKGRRRAQEAEVRGRPPVPSRNAPARTDLT
jgi:signal transduction histidine kinase